MAQSKFDEIRTEALRRAYLPHGLARPERLVDAAVLLLAEQLNVTVRAAFAEAVGDRFKEGDAAKVERSSDEMIEALAAREQVSASVADDLLGAVFEALWLVLGRDWMERCIRQVPADVARWLMAAMPGDKRGAF